MIKAQFLPRSPVAWIDAAIASAWVVVAAIIVAIAADIAYAGGISAPFLDLWAYTNPDAYLAHLFERHNGHPLLINRLALALDYEVFDGTGDAVRFGTLLVKAGEALSFFWLARLAGVSSRRDRIVVAAAAVAIAFCAAPHINLRQQFQFSFVLAFAATSGAIASLTAYAARPQLWRFALACALGAVATQSLLNGLLTPLLLIVLAARFKLPWTHIAALAGIFVLALLSIVLNPASTPGMPPINLSLFLNTLEIVGGAPGSLLGYAGGQLGVELGSPSTISIIFGVLMALASLPTAWRVVRGRATQVETAAFAIILFGAASAGMMALGRAWVAGNDSVVARYTESSIMVLGGLMVVGAATLSHLKPLWTRTALIGALPLALVLAFGGPPVLKLDQSVQRARLTAQTAQIVDIPDRRATGALGGAGVGRRYFGPASRDLMAHGKMHYADVWARSMTAIVPPSAESERACDGRITLLSSPYDGFVRVRGTVAGVDARAARSVVVVDAARQMVGYGRIARRWDDFMLPFIERSPHEVVGYARREGDGLDYTLYLANQDGLQCRLHYRVAPSLQNPSARRRS